MFRRFFISALLIATVAIVYMVVASCFFLNNSSFIHSLKSSDLNLRPGQEPTELEPAL